MDGLSLYAGYFAERFGLDPSGNDYNSKSYVAGELVETVGEIVVTGGLALGKKAGQKFAQNVGKKGLAKLEKKGKDAARDLLIKKGTPKEAFKRTGGNLQMHHKNPVRQGKFARPQQAASVKNIVAREGSAFVKGTAHKRAHDRLKLLEKLDDARDLTLGTRQLVNEIRRQMETQGSNFDPKNSPLDKKLLKKNCP